MAMRVFVEACQRWCFENKNYRYDVTIQTTYFDYGQNWKYTAFITYDEDEDDKWQSLCPRDWELVVTETDINKIIAMAWFYMDNVGKPYTECKKLYEKF
jgi:hypothetical protein